MPAARSLSHIEFTTDDPGDGATAPTWTEIDDYLDENYEAPTEEPATVTYGDQTDEQQGVTCSGAFAAVSEQLPPKEGRVWFRFVPYEGNAQIVGGPRGCRATLASSGIKKLGSGREYTMVRYTCSAGGAGGTIEEEAAAA